MPNHFKDGGNTFMDEPIQTTVATFKTLEESNPAIKAEEAATSSGLKQKNSCRAEKGKTLFGKASLMRPRFVSSVNNGSLNPSIRRISFLKLLSIFFLSLMLYLHALEFFTFSIILRIHPNPGSDNLVSK